MGLRARNNDERQRYQPMVAAAPRDTVHAGVTFMVAPRATVHAGVTDMAAPRGTVYAEVTVVAAPVGEKPHVLGIHVWKKRKSVCITSNFESQFEDSGISCKHCWKPEGLHAHTEKPMIDYQNREK